MTTFTIADSVPLIKKDFNSVMEAVYYLTLWENNNRGVFDDFEIEHFTDLQQQDLLSSGSHQKLTSAIVSLWL